MIWRVTVIIIFKAAIIHALDEVCSVVPAEISKDCRDFINKYGKDIVEMLIDEVESGVICSNLFLCSARPPIKKSQVFDFSMILLDSSLASFVLVFNILSCFSHLQVLLKSKPSSAMLTRGPTKARFIHLLTVVTPYGQRKAVATTNKLPKENFIFEQGATGVESI